jgi:hypothetical protein
MPRRFVIGSAPAVIAVVLDKAGKIDQSAQHKYPLTTYMFLEGIFDFPFGDTFLLFIQLLNPDDNQNISPPA